MLVLAAAFALSMCACSEQKLFVADDSAIKEAEVIIDGFSDRVAADSYIMLRQLLLEYSTASSSRRAAINDAIASARKIYGFGELNMNDDINKNNRILFNAMMAKAFYENRELDETLLDDSSDLMKAILAEGYTHAEQVESRGYQNSMKYYYTSDEGYDIYNYYSLTSLKDNRLMYLSMPLVYDGDLEETYFTSFSAMSEEARLREFDSRLNLMLSSTSVVDNDALGVLYSGEELESLDRFLKSLSSDYLNENSCFSVDDEASAYSSAQLLAELGDTRFVLRVTLYGVFMDVIQNKDYYTGAFMTDLCKLESAYVDPDASYAVDSDDYVVITGFGA